MTQENFLTLTKAIFTTHDVEVDCEECDAEMARLAELVNAGGDPAELLPAVYAHLQRCRACGEEFEALLSVLQAETTGQIAD